MASVTCMPRRFEDPLCVYPTYSLLEPKPEGKKVLTIT